MACRSDEQRDAGRRTRNACQAGKGFDLIVAVFPVRIEGVDRIPLEIPTGYGYGRDQQGGAGCEAGPGTLFLFLAFLQQQLLIGASLCRARTPDNEQQNESVMEPSHMDKYLC